MWVSQESELGLRCVLWDKPRLVATDKAIEMRTIDGNGDTDHAELVRELTAALDSGGLVCLPCNGKYRILADLMNADAVLRLGQAKRRVTKAPVLVFIDHEDSLDQVAAEVDPLALKVASQLWPHPLTIRVKPSADLPKKVLRQFGGKRMRIGVRIPADPLCREVVAAVGRPLLVSSANREKKVGSSSAAQVRNNFANKIDIFLDYGDLQPGPPSTVIRASDDHIVVERAGAVAEETLQRLCTS